MGIKYQIIIEIDEDENIKLETKGFKGPSCMDELKTVSENILEINSTSKTKEFYEKTKNTIKKKISRFSK